MQSRQAARPGFAAIVSELLTATFGARAGATPAKPLKAAAGATDANSRGTSVMAVGFGLLRLSPEAFWSMTPRELERAMSVFGESDGQRRAAHDLPP